MSQNDQYQYMLSIAALVMSALAMIFAFMELRSSDKQFEANVWPYVDLDITINSDTFEVAVSNKGMGPALIHEFRIRHDGDDMSNPNDLIDRAGFVAPGDLSLSSASIASSVLSTGESVRAMRIEGVDSGLALIELVPSLEIDICYCAINGTCWNNAGDNPFRSEVEECGVQDDNIHRLLEDFEPSDPAPEPDTP